MSMLDPKQHRVGILGCGLIAGYHILAYQAIGMPIVAGADISEEALHKVVNSFGIPRTYTSYVELLEKEQLDIVSICTPPLPHREMAEAAVANGVKAIVMEKPMAVDLATADAMIEACERAGVIFIVNHQRRFSSQFILARRWIDEGRIGTVEQIVTGVRGDLYHDGTHVIDLLRFCLNDLPVQRVFGIVERDGTNAYGTINKRWPVGTRYGHPVESTAMAEIIFENDIRAVLEVGYKISRPAPNNEPTTRIYGSKGIIEVNTPGCVLGSYDTQAEIRNGARITIFGQQPLVDPVIGTQVHEGWEVISYPEDEIKYSTYSTVIARSIQALLDCMSRGVNDHPLRAKSARVDLEIIMAIYESTRRKMGINFPVTFGHSPLQAMIEAGEI